MNETTSLEFSISLGECESFVYIVHDEDCSKSVTHDEVRDYIKSLVGQVKGFTIDDEGRIEGDIFYYDDNTMEMSIRYFKPLSDKPRVKMFNDIPSILPKFKCD